VKRSLLNFAVIWACFLAYESALCQKLVPENEVPFSKLSQDQFEKTVLQFEDSISSLAQWLEKSKLQDENTKAQIISLEGRIAALRKDDQNTTNVFSGIRLKNLLNELKENLEKKADFLHQRDEKQAEFEQKALSLTALYNDRIEMELGSVSAEMQPSDLQSKFNRIAQLIQKRDRVESTLARYKKKTNETKSYPVLSFDSLKIDDRESLQLTLGLIQDRKKELDEKIQKESIEEEEIKNELNLQLKMQEFLDGIKRMNEESDFPNQDFRKNDFSSIVGGHQKKKLELRLKEIQDQISSDQMNLSRLNQLGARIQDRSDEAKGGDSK